MKKLKPVPDDPELIKEMFYEMFYGITPHKTINEGDLPIHHKNTFHWEKL